MFRNKQKLLHSKRGFTLVELVVVIAILSICSSMLVGVIAGSVDRYSKSSDVENCKQEAVNFEEYYKRCLRGAFTAEVDSSYNTASFTTQENCYYMIINPANHSIRFAMSDGSGGLSNIITCRNVYSLQHQTRTIGKDDNQTYMDYQISMLSSYEPDVTYDYPGTVVLNNGSSITVPNTVYELDSMTDEVCITFRMIP